MQEHFDALETRNPDLREAVLMAALPAQIAHAKAHAPFFSRIFASVEPSTINSRAALAALPVTRKSELHEFQAALRPFGGLNATAPGALARILMSPGPIYDPEGRRADYWQSARGLFAAGFRAGDVVQNCFSYHLTPAGTMFETGLHALGCAVIPAGVGQTEMQVQVMRDLAVSGYVGTPSFLKIILEKAEELNQPVITLKRAQVSGEAFFPAQRDALKARGIAAFQAYGTADLGMIAYESEAREGLIVNENIILEIVRPGTGNPVPDGEVGEVLVTVLSADYPLMRFATGDLSAVLPGRSACGRTNIRIKGWLGRADQTTKVRGLFVHPHQVAAALARAPGISKVRAVVDNPDGQDRLRLLCEAGAQDDQLITLVESALRDITKLRAEASFVAIGSLPNDGKVIEDLRKLD